MSTYILIHGSWHGAWCWYKVTPRLEAAGHKVIVPDMPGHGRDWRPPGQVTMRDFVDTITQNLDQEDEPVVLVAHSRNGVVITQVAEERPQKIRTLVYLAALLLPSGVRAWDWDDPDSLLRPHMISNEQEGWDMIRRDRKVFREALYADCSDEEIALAYALLTPEPTGPMSPTHTPVRTTPENFGRVPRVYIELTQDQGLRSPRRPLSATQPKRRSPQTPISQVVRCFYLGHRLLGWPTP